MRRTRRRLPTPAGVALVALLAMGAACADPDSSDSADASDATTTPGTGTSNAPTTTAAPTRTTLPDGVTPPPSWLGTRVLPLRPDGVGEIQPTPPELRDRRFVTTDHIDPPSTPDFAATVDPVPADVAARSTWRPECPVALDELRYITLVFRGFDGEDHTGELLVHADVAEDVIDVFEQVYDAGFPIEEMRIVRADELDAPPTGDGNNTSAFACRPVALGSNWSQHAYGRAVDVNPFHNPYVREDVVLPELASAYTDRSMLRPGMVVRGDAVTGAFAAIGWAWGGDFRPLTDPMHFSADGG